MYNNILLYLFVFTTVLVQSDLVNSKYVIEYDNSELFVRFSALPIFEQCMKNKIYIVFNSFFLLHATKGIV